jgi:hypothetical protein
MNSNDNPDGLYVEARYTELRIPRYRGNPLIEALPPILDDEALAQELTQFPDFDTSQRDWPTHERLLLVAGLANFMVPMPRHIQLARSLETLIYEGYVGRTPRTADHVRTLQMLYEKQKAGATFSSALTGQTAVLSTALVGPSGMGKTVTTKRRLALIPPVIHHPGLHIWQIPCLHIETPHDGASAKGLAHAILRKVDSLVPDANYYEKYALRGKPGVETLLNHVARVLHMHFVGLLVVDEVQNLENAPKNKQALMSLLVSASNELGVPILFIGTNKARRVLGLDFRQARRSTGYGQVYWDRLAKGDLKRPGEWEDFINTLWHFQWVRRPVDLNPFLADLMYHHSQGIIDIAIKLFAAVQWRAMLDESETITAQLIDDCAKHELALVMPMIDAIRRQDAVALAAYDDVAPLNYESMLKDVQNRYEGKRLRAASIRPGDEPFAPQLAASLAQLGLGVEQAIALADSIEATGQATNLLEGCGQAIQALKPPKAVRAKKGESPEPEAFLPGDLRNAIQQAKSDQTTVFEALKATRMLCNLNEVLELG